MSYEMDLVLEKTLPIADVNAMRFYSPRRVLWVPRKEKSSR